jgi:hypothetical protein
MTGAYVSGMRMTKGKLAPDKMSPIQKHHRQLTTATKPETQGPIIGPNVVHCWKCQSASRYTTQYQQLKTHCHEIRHQSASQCGIVVHIGKKPTHSGDRRGRNHSVKQSENEQRSIRICDGARQCEYHE